MRPQPSRISRNTHLSLDIGHFAVPRIPPTAEGVKETKGRLMIEKTSTNRRRRQRHFRASSTLAACFLPLQPLISMVLLSLHLLPAFSSTAQLNLVTFKLRSDPVPLPSSSPSPQVFACTPCSPRTPRTY